MAYRNLFQRYVQKLLGINDTPESIALGTATGLLIGMTPTVGVQIILILIINSLVRANRLAGVIMVNISNPITLIPLYWLDYQVGAWLLGVERVSAERFEQVFANFKTRAAESQWWDAFWELAVVNVEIYVPMFVGGVLLGLGLALPVYPVMLRFMRAHQRRRAHRHALLRLRAIRRAERAAARERTHETHAAGWVVSGPSSQGSEVAVENAPAAAPQAFDDAERSERNHR